MAYDPPVKHFGGFEKIKSLILRWWRPCAWKNVHMVSWTFFRMYGRHRHVSANFIFSEQGEWRPRRGGPPLLFCWFRQNASGGGHACWVQIGRSPTNRPKCLNYYPLIKKTCLYNISPTSRMCHFVYHTRKIVKFTKNTQNIGEIGEHINSFTLIRCMASPKMVGLP